ncbi:c-type cytochrome domain-containing protein [Thalassoglobus polymorphus]|uniref:WD domain, G-beta repeat n=1 Tax=Thalassoglobus polymorphus TaxID=2527994 RepID=A0A517QLV8_9PLAN|nr:c-type cytochrome domain-containing protein [Thalassoglobus polymorphus]QDT32616.1 WD domain, G-beta repeat [Thalassoglobus polymorphus]
MSLTPFRLIVTALLPVMLFEAGTSPDAFSQDVVLHEKTEAARRSAIQQHMQRKTYAAEIATSRLEIQQLKLSLVPIEAMQKELQTQLVELNKKLIEEQKQAEAANKELDAKVKLQADVKEKVEAAKLASEAAKKEFENREAAVKKTQDSIAEAKKKVEELAAASMKQLAAITRLDEEIRKVSAKLQESEKLEALQWQQVRESAIQNKNWVSFSDEIAPILQKRCLACHNESKPRGQLKFDSYAQMLHGGESGELFDFESPGFSTLVTMIEDGSMPKEDDPLSPEQISVITRWVTLGAQYDSQLDPGTPLIEVMARPTYPLPPETYPFPVPVEAVAIHADGKRIVSSGYHEILVWSVESGELLQRIPGFPERIYSLKFQGDSNILAVGAGTPGEVGEVIIVDLASSKKVKQLHVSPSIITCLIFSADQNQLAVGGADGQVHIFETQAWAKTQTFHAHSDWVTDVCFSPDGSKLVSASRDKTAKVFELSTGENLIAFNGHGNVVNAVRFLSSGNEVVSGGDDRRIRVWSITDAKEVRNVTGFAGSISAIELLSDGKLATTSTDKKLRLHTAADNKVEKTRVGPVAELLSLGVSETFAVTGALNGELHLWLVSEEKPVRSWFAKPETVPNSNSQ